MKKINPIAASIALSLITIYTYAQASPALSDERNPHSLTSPIYYWYAAIIAVVVLLGVIIFSRKPRVQNVSTGQADNHPEYSPDPNIHPGKARLSPKYILLIGFVAFILIALLFWLVLL